MSALCIGCFMLLLLKNKQTLKISHLQTMLDYQQMSIYIYFLKRANIEYQYFECKIPGLPRGPIAPSTPGSP